MSRQRREVHYRGRVQGVGFRLTASEVARGYDVTGFVQNLPDGSVRLVAEAEPEELEAFLAAVRRAMQGYIHGEDVVSQPATGEFRQFSIRR